MALVNFDTSAIIAMEGDACIAAVDAMAESLVRISALTRSMQKQNSLVREQNTRLREHIKELQVLNQATIQQLEGELADKVRELEILFDRFYAHLNRVYSPEEHAAAHGNRYPPFPWKEANARNIYEGLLQPYTALNDRARSYQNNPPPQ